MDFVLRPYGPDDLDLLRAIDAPEMKEHLGGSEGADATLARHEKYLASPPGDHVLVIEVDGERAGAVLCWDIGDTVKEAGWSVLPSFQGRGIATRAVVSVADIVRADGATAVHAFPQLANGPSNRVCAKAGFVLVGPTEVEFPKGSVLQVNDWRLDL